MVPRILSSVVFWVPTYPVDCLSSTRTRTSDVKSSRPKWPRGQNFGILSYYVIGHFSCKNRVKFGNFVNFSGDNLKSCVVNHYLVLFHNYFWPQPRPHSPGPGLSLEVLASFNITDSDSNRTYCVSAFLVLVFTARCTLVQSAVLRSHVVCLSVCLSVCL